MVLTRMFRMPRYLSLSLPGVFFLGTFVTLLVRYLLYLYHPQLFVESSLSISRTAAFDPGKTVFTIGITITVVMILITWYLIFHFNCERIKRIANAADRPWALNLLAYCFGLISALFLALLALIHSKLDSELHEAFSIAFYFTQVAAFMFDYFLWRALLRNKAVNADEYPHGRRKALLFKLLGIVSVLTFSFYLLRVFAIFDRQLISSAFVFFEYTISVLCYLYAYSYYPEVRKSLYE